MRALQVWAPAAQSVDVLLGDERVPMTRAGEDWTVEVDAADGTPYSFSLDGGPPRSVSGIDLMVRTFAVTSSPRTPSPRVAPRTRRRFS